MGVGDSWGTREQLLHPRDSHGRFRSTWKMAAGVVEKLLATLSAFNPKTFSSDEEAGNYVHGIARSNRFMSNRGPAIDRFLKGYSKVNADLRAGKPNADSAAIDKGMSPLRDDLILSRVVGPEAFGLNPQNIGQVEELTGKLISDKGYSSTNIGTPMPHGAGQITMSIAAPKGTKALAPSVGTPTREIILGRDQPLRITKVDPDGQGGFYVYAVATGDSEGEKPVDIGKAIPGNGVPESGPEVAPGPEVGPGPTGPVPGRGPGRPPGPGPGERNDGHVGIVGQGNGPESGGTGEVTPGGTGEVTPELPPGPEKGDDSRNTFRAAFEEAQLKMPTVGNRRKEFTDAYLGVASGKKTPQQAVNDLDNAISVNKRILASDAEDGTDSGPLAEDIKRQEALSDLIKEHFNFTGRKDFKGPEPEKKVPAKKTAPAKKVAKKAAAPEVKGSEGTGKSRFRSSDEREQKLNEIKERRLPKPGEKVVPYGEADRDRRVGAFREAAAAVHEGKSADEIEKIAFMNAEKIHPEDVGWMSDILKIADAVRQGDLAEAKRRATANLRSHGKRGAEEKFIEGLKRSRTRGPAAKKAAPEKKAVPAKKAAPEKKATPAKKTAVKKAAPEPEKKTETEKKPLFGEENEKRAQELEAERKRDTDKLNADRDAHAEVLRKGAPKGPELKDDEALNAPKIKLDELSKKDARAKALWKYIGNSDDFAELNRHLREGDTSTGTQSRATKSIDSLMSDSELDKPILVYRGLTSVESVFGDDGDTNGKTFTDGAFVSTTSDPRVATEFGKVQMRIKVPKGTKALRLQDINKNDREEREILLDRGLEFRVTKDQKIGDNRVLDVEIVPKGTGTKGTPDKVSLEGEKAPEAPGDLDKMTIPQLREEAKRQDKKIPSSARRKADIVAFLKGDGGKAPEPEKKTGSEIKGSPDLDEAYKKTTVAQLRQQAADAGIDVPKNLRLKRDIFDHVTKELARKEMEKRSGGEVKTPEKVATKKATPERLTEHMRPGKTNASRVGVGERILVSQDAKGNWVSARNKTGATPITVTKKEAVKMRSRQGYRIHGEDDNGNQITIADGPGIQTFWTAPDKGGVTKKATPAKKTDLGTKLRNLRERLDSIDTAKQRELGLPALTETVERWIKDVESGDMTQEQVEKALTSLGGVRYGVSDNPDTKRISRELLDTLDGIRGGKPGPVKKVTPAKKATPEVSEKKSAAMKDAEDRRIAKEARMRLAGERRIAREKAVAERKEAREKLAAAKKQEAEAEKARKQAEREQERLRKQQEREAEKLRKQQERLDLKAAKEKEHRERLEAEERQRLLESVQDFDRLTGKSWTVKNLRSLADSEGIKIPRDLRYRSEIRDHILTERARKHAELWGALKSRRQLLDMSDELGIPLPESVRRSMDPRVLADYVAESQRIVAEMGIDPKEFKPLQEYTGHFPAGDTDPNHPLAIRHYITDQGYKITRGFAIKKNGIGYLIETDAASPHRDSPYGPARIVKELEDIHAGLPDGNKYQRTYGWNLGRSPGDEYWAKKFNNPNQRALASAGGGHVDIWDQSNPNFGGDGPKRYKDSLHHEYGHNVDGHGQLSRADYISVSARWSDAARNDSGRLSQLPGMEGFTPRYYTDMHPVSITSDPTRGWEFGVSRYGKSSPGEDFAESIAQYMMMKPLGRTRDGKDWYFWDLFPSRAAQLERVLPELKRRRDAFIASQRA